MTLSENIEILFEDNHLLVINKPAYVLSQGDHTGDDDLLSLLKQYLKKKYNKPGNVFLGLVHRLDRMTQGVMVFAKTSKAASRLSEQIRARSFKKKYDAIVTAHSSVLVCGQRYTHFLEKDEKQKKAIVHSRLSKRNKEAIMDIGKIVHRSPLMLVEIELVTGRFHQIRAQLAALGSPVYGDHKYNPSAKPGENMALLCKELSFYHPTKKEPLVFHCPLPSEKPWTLFVDGS